MQQNNGLKFSHDRKNYIDFQLDVLGGGGWGYFENVQWTLSVKESICVQPLIKFATPCHDSLKWWVQLGFKPQYGMKGVCAGHVRCTALVDGARIGPQNATSCLCNTTLGIHLRVHGVWRTKSNIPHWFKPTPPDCSGCKVSGLQNDSF